MFSKARHKRESKTLNKCETRNKTVFSHSSVSPRNNKQCSAKQCFGESNKQVSSQFCISKWPISGKRTRLTKHRRKVNQRHLILETMYTTMWLQIYCWLAVSHMFRFNMILESSNVFFCFGVTQTINRECAKPFRFLFLVFWLSFAPALRIHSLAD